MRFLVILTVGIGFLTGCSKSEKLGAEVSAPASDAAPTMPAAALEASYQDVSKKMEAKQYEAAVGALVSLNGVPKDAQQQGDFRNQMQQMNMELERRAAEGDQNARASREMLGRFMLGR